ncbi:MAG: DUF1295 domain-containing protein [Hyphomonadaceae bacterium]
MEIAAILGVNAAMTAAAFLLLWRVAVVIEDASFVDAWWAAGFVLIAWTTFMLTGGRGPHALMLLALTTLWGLRLAIYLFGRWRAHGIDRRYAAMMGKAKRDKGWSFERASLLYVFALQAPLQFLVSLPVQAGMAPETEAFGNLAWAGVALWALGFAFESIGDWQLARFKADEANAGKVMDRGLWRYTRHPNYFGDACVWWGLYLIAADAGVPLWALSGPIAMTLLLAFWSGAPTIEGHLKRTKPDYAAYVARTSAFIPWPPKTR